MAPGAAAARRRAPARAGRCRPRGQRGRRPVGGTGRPCRRGRRGRRAARPARTARGLPPGALAGLCPLICAFTRVVPFTLSRMRRRFPHLPALLCVSLFLAGCAGGGANVRADQPAPEVVASAPAESEAPAGPEAQEAQDLGSLVLSVDFPGGRMVIEGEPAGEAATESAASADPATNEPTQAEYDYAAICGGQVYDPVADPTLPPPAELPEAYDPWEPLNRRVHAFNNLVDRTIASPLAHAYVKVVPRPVRLGVRNFFTNRGQPALQQRGLRPDPGQVGLARIALCGAAAVRAAHRARRVRPDGRCAAVADPPGRGRPDPHLPAGPATGGRAHPVVRGGQHAR